MSRDSATLTRAKQALRAYDTTNQNAPREEAHSALRDLILSDDSDIDSKAVFSLSEARQVLSISPAAANAADNLLDLLVR
ncbi:MULTISPECIES: hypothetical protein [unclassified Frigoribacterium]|uniref:hypothetical protein n=1 Tax=unclassified Frigoribacterium TaxID=2627005 RepID=UPI0006F9A043|nr:MULTISPECIES: hypothetical protein [unclassified Frigoribacterium]KQO48124.1 hypothetical protein ASF07_12255 [Frigoribacterium sp. Leaf254]KQT40218.1 hypothetical protein ASG28_12265 [Frigoribacterium sp. Leaf415]